jgi:hypothetical protein
LGRLRTIAAIGHLISQQSIGNGNEVVLCPFEFLFDLRRSGGAVGDQQVQSIMFVLIDEEVDHVSDHLAHRGFGPEAVHQLVECSQRS